MKYFLISISSALLGMIILTYVLDANHVGQNDVIRLKIENELLVKSNQKLDSLNMVLMNKIYEENKEINILTIRDKELKDKVNSMNVKIKTLNIKYEKAISYSNGFESSEIARYFSNL